MGNAYLPINENWELFYKTNEKSCEETKEAGARALVTAAKRVLDDLKPDMDGEARVDAWLFDVDWSFRGDHEFPEWYFKLFSKRGNVYLDKESLTSEDVTMKSAYVPLIFASHCACVTEIIRAKNEVRETSDDSLESHCPPFWEYEHICKVISKNIQEFGDMEPFGKAHAFGFFHFYRLPHPLGGQNVGDPLGKHFLRYIDSKILRPTRHVDEFFVLLEAMKVTKFWTNYAKRVESEIPVWYETNEGPRLGAIAPAIIPAGTVSRRSVHKLWVTLTNESEQWLAGLFGDASHAKALPECARQPGLTPFSNMMLAGSKSDGTDLHSVVANQLKIDRSQAKALNYARMYGAGEINATKTLSQAGMTMDQATKTAKELFAVTKGTESSWKMLRKEVQPLLLKFVAERQLDKPGNYLTVDGRFYIPNYDNHMNESATFNYLEMQTHREVLRTPVLDCRLSDSLSALPKETPDRWSFTAKYKRSVMNWISQSEGSLQRKLCIERVASVQSQQACTIPSVKAIRRH
ncbi:hypothetical protein OSTOST_14596 [Ostertagia ostertagi]